MLDVTLDDERGLAAHAIERVKERMAHQRWALKPIDRTTPKYKLPQSPPPRSRVVRTINNPHVHYVRTTNHDKLVYEEDIATLEADLAALATDPDKREQYNRLVAYASSLLKH